MTHPRKYILLAAYCPGELSDKIQRLLDKGWEFRGGLHITGADTSPRYHQAMVLS